MQLFHAVCIIVNNANYKLIVMPLFGDSFVCVISASAYYRCVTFVKLCTLVMFVFVDM
jgi:hypothetical protein